MSLTTYDLSEITDNLVNLLTNAVENSPLWTSEGGSVPNFLVNVSGSSPDTMRNAAQGECQLNFYLLHVGQDPYFRNTPIFGTSAMGNSQQPLSLNLSYLLTAYAPDNALREQQAMSIALAYFHENAIYQSAPDPVTGQYQYLTIGLGPDTLSEMSALWQSFTVAYRLSTIYRVAIAFITPSQPPSAPAPNPNIVGLSVIQAPVPPAPPAAAGVAGGPQLFLPRITISNAPPASGPDYLDVLTVQETPAMLQGGLAAQLSGLGLAPATPLTLNLSTVDGTQNWSITTWQSAPPTSGAMTITPPTTYAIGTAAAPPASTPPPGVYLLSVGNPGAFSAPIPVIIAPIFTNVSTPPVLTMSGGSYRFSGAGFVPGATQLFVNGTLLAPDSVIINGAGTSVTFTLPAGTPPGTVPLRVRVEGIDAPATWQVAA
jgi:hypothetical protein